jgi:hypothetical protein
MWKSEIRKTSDFSRGKKRLASFKPLLPTALGIKLVSCSISSIAWFMFFSDDQAYLEQLDSEIKGLMAISKQEESNL